MNDLDLQQDCRQIQNKENITRIALLLLSVFVAKEAFALLVAADVGHRTHALFVVQDKDQIHEQSNSRGRSEALRQQQRTLTATSSTATDNTPRDGEIVTKKSNRYEREIYP